MPHVLIEMSVWLAGSLIGLCQTNFINALMQKFVPLFIRVLEIATEIVTAGPVRSLKLILASSDTTARSTSMTLLIYSDINFAPIIVFGGSKIVNLVMVPHAVIDMRYLWTHRDK